MNANSPPSEQQSTTVCAHYYPWYGPDSHWDEGYVETPLLGEFDSSQPAVVDQNLLWAERFGIDWFSTSWWGPRSREDRVLTTTFADRILDTDIEYSILYESLGRLDGTVDGIDVDRENNRKRLLADFEYLEEHHFGHPNYRRVDGKPVVYLWPSRAFRGDIVSLLEEVRAELDTTPYVWGNFVSPYPPTGADRDRTRAFDAISMYNPYALWRRARDSDRPFGETLSAHYRQWRAAAEGGDAHFYPTVIPGFDNTESGGDLPVFPRDAERFRADCRSVREMGDAEVNTVVVTSFNEFHEGTHIEPTVETGHSLLEAVKDELATAEMRDPLAGLSTLEFEFSRAHSPRSDNRQLAFAVDRFALRDGTASVAEYDIGGTDGLLFGGGVYAAESDGVRNWRWMGGTSRRGQVFVDLGDVDAATTLTVGGLGIDSDVRVSVWLDERQLGEIAPSNRWDEYELSVPDDVYS